MNDYGPTPSAAQYYCWAARQLEVAAATLRALASDLGAVHFGSIHLSLAQDSMAEAARYLERAALKAVTERAAEK